MIIWLTIVCTLTLLGFINECVDFFGPGGMLHIILRSANGTSTGTPDAPGNGISTGAPDAPDWTFSSALTVIIDVCTVCDIVRTFFTASREQPTRRLPCWEHFCTPFSIKYDLSGSIDTRQRKIIHDYVKSGLVMDVLSLYGTLGVIISMTTSKNILYLQALRLLEFL